MTRDTNEALGAIGNDPLRFRYLIFYNTAKSVDGQQANISAAGVMARY
ncbi:hypothetical protein K1Y77_16150 [Halomonas qaidamensis]|uniref:Uncharacterized protein n=1 Tax=Halomonas qaidamensis TaxID=2866211 RepID=A0ABY6JPE1_9GAMM|nr:hypothetical protein [Halomonas qaidamensis]UYV18954.1 hypothetical protein K1Y77_16150 [Halomonas qaidamensis]